MVFNGKFTRIIITGLLCGLLSTVAAFAASSDTKAEMDSVKAQLDSYSQVMDNAHQMAEYARVLGESEDSVIIQTAKQYWHSANDEYVALYPSYIALNKQYNEELAAEKEAEEQAQAQKGQYAGRYRVSFYCTGSCCNGSNSGITALGTSITPWYTVAVDPSVIPLGSKIRIPGLSNSVFYCADTGGAIKGNKIDVAVSSHSEAMRLGIQYHDVYIVK